MPVCGQAMFLLPQRVGLSWMGVLIGVTAIGQTIQFGMLQALTFILRRDKMRSKSALRFFVGFSICFVLTLVLGQEIFALTVPQDFENIQVIGGLDAPDGLVFSPDGRIFISERITGKLLVAKYNDQTDQWILNATPFYTFDVPHEQRRSAGLRDIAFDPDFANNGYIYAYYMKHGVFHNRVVRIKASTANPDLADASFGEQLLFEVPFNSASNASSGSHNGGAVEFGADGKLYFTTGDGWEDSTEGSAGDPVQSLTTFTGKVFRINRDGSIPSDNPFYNSTSGNYRAIYALGLRNPYSMSSHPQTGILYVNDAYQYLTTDSHKADIFILEAGANYRYHRDWNFDPPFTIGNVRYPWANAAAGSTGLSDYLVTGGAWYPSSGPFPSEYHGGYFTALWGEFWYERGQINLIESPTNTAVSVFASDLGEGPAGSEVKPVTTRIGPDGNLYFVMTTYVTNIGTVQRIRYTQQSQASPPLVWPNGGDFSSPISVNLANFTAYGQIYYTTDGSEPTNNATPYTGPFTVSTTTQLRARVYKSGMAPSAVVTADFIFPPPIVVAPTVVLNESGATFSLDWDGGSACEYEIHEGQNPYFITSSLLGTVSSSTNSFVVNPAVGDTAVNNFYRVRAVCAALQADSNEVGEFDFTFLPGD